MSSPTVAIVNGTDVTGDSFVVTLLPDGAGRNYCSGVYFEPFAVITAAHCVLANDGKKGELRWPLSQMYVSQPGVDWSKREAWNSRVRVKQVWVTDEYFNRWKPELGQWETKIDDIAFLFLEQPLKGTPIRRFATLQEVELFRDGVGNASQFGYGCLGIDAETRQLVENDGKPYRADNLRATRWLDRLVNQKPDRFLQVLYPRGTSVCPGDSGGPLILIFPDGGTAYVGVQFAGNGWLSAQDPNSNTIATGEVTTFYPFAEIFSREYNNFLAEWTPTSTTTSTIASRKTVSEKVITCQTKTSRIRVVGKNPKCPSGSKTVKKP